MKRILIIAIALWGISNIYASTSQSEPQAQKSERNRFEKLTQDWANPSDTSGGLRGGGIGDDEEPGGGLSVPVSALPLVGMILCGSLYAAGRRQKTIYKQSK